MIERKTATSNNLNDTSSGAFTIINRSREINTNRAEYELKLHKILQRCSPDIAKIFEQLPKPLREAALSSSVSSSPLNASHTADKEDINQTKILNSFTAAVRIAYTRAKATTVGILDLGSRISELKKLLNCMNMAQDRMVFLEVQTPVPAGMVKTGDALAQEFQKALGKSNFCDSSQKELGCNILVNEFMTFGKAVHEQNGLDILIGITPAMLAYHHNNEAFYNNFSYGGGGPISMVSTYDLRSYAKKANRPFEAAVGKLLVGRIISNCNNLSFPKEPGAWTLDNNSDQEDFIESIRKMRIDKRCIDAIRKKDEGKAVTARKLMRALQRMKVGDPW